MNKELRILILEDTFTTGNVVETALREEGLTFLAKHAEIQDSFLHALESFKPDLVLADYAHPSLDGLSALRLIETVSPDTPLIIMTPSADDEKTIDCIREGAADSICRDHFARLVQAVKGAIAKSRAEKSLKESEERYRRITEAISDYVYTVQVRNGVPVRTLHGPACEAVTGYTSEEFETNPTLWIDMVYDEDKQAVIEHANRILSGAPTTPLEHRLVRKDGTVRWVKNTAVPHLDNEGSLISYDGLIRDITERKLAEEARKKVEAQLRQAQKMEAIGTLAGGIAHDFNNILGAIVGYTELAQLDAIEGSRQKTNLGQVLKAARRAKDLVGQILTFSRQREQEFKPTQVSLVVKEVLKLLRASLPTTIEIKHDLRTDALCLADPTQIHQVLMNLCTNAAHAMGKKGGVLGVSLGLERSASGKGTDHHALQPGPYLLLTVQDTGHGMSPEVMERIFDPFFTTKGKGVGTGMGLSVVHGIVRSHGGTVYAQSEPGTGTTFDVFLPAIERMPEPIEKEMRPLPRGTERVLFVDDEEPLVDIGKRLLEALGYQVTTRTSSQEALRLFEETPENFDLVITDMTMPSMTGDTLAKALMSIRADIPVILSTGFSSNISEEEAIELGIRAFVVKPFLLENLSKTIRQVLEP